jgi:hypothetical protein
LYSYKGVGSCFADVVLILHNNVNVMVAVPLAGKIEYKAAVKQQYPVLENVWATKDGLK